MYQFPIGVRSNNFRLGLRESIKMAAEIGCNGIQLQATDGETAAENMSKEGRRELLKFTKDLGLKFSALCGDFGGHGFMIDSDNAARIERSKRVLEMALDLECNIVTTHIGILHEDEFNPRWDVMRRACSSLSKIGDQLGGYFAIETGPEPSARLKKFLDSLDGHGMKVNFDPANLAMVIGEDIPAAVHTLKDYIVHTHAKDGKMLVKTNPENIYGFFEEDKIEQIKYFEETPLGTGNVPFPAYLNALDEIGFKGYLTIEREVGATPVNDIRLAVEFLKQQMK